MCIYVSARRYIYMFDIYVCMCNSVCLWAGERMCIRCFVQKLVDSKFLVWQLEVWVCVCIYGLRVFYVLCMHSSMCPCVCTCVYVCVCVGCLVVILSVFHEQLFYMCRRSCAVSSLLASHITPGDLLTAVR